MKEKIKELYLKGYNSKQISEIVGKKDTAIRKCISRNLKEFNELHNEQVKLMQDKEKLDVIDNIKRLYLKGYNPKEIAQMVELTYGHIRNFISDNLRSYSHEHRKARDLNKSIIKAINSTNNSYMNNSAFLKHNRQSYKYNKKHNLVFDEETRGAKPKDVPEKFYTREAI